MTIHGFSRRSEIVAIQRPRIIVKTGYERAGGLADEQVAAASRTLPLSTANPSNLSRELLLQKGLCLLLVRINVHEYLIWRRLAGKDF
jgi:hypothetical protein